MRDVLSHEHTHATHSRARTKTYLDVTRRLVAERAHERNAAAVGARLDTPGVKEGVVGDRKVVRCARIGVAKYHQSTDGGMNKKKKEAGDRVNINTVAVLEASR